MTTIGIIGTGAVGQAVASTLVAARLGQHLVLKSSTVDQAAACAADVQDMSAALGSRLAVYSADTVDELRDCNAIVVAVRGGFATHRGADVRMGGLGENSKIVHRIGAALRGYPGVVLMVTNPVDVMSRLFAARSGCAVYGIGAGLDSARYRALLGAVYGVPARRIHGEVIGEHGDAAVCCLSTTRVDGALIDPDDPRTHRALAAFATRSQMIRGGVGRVRGGAAGAVLSALRTVLGLVDGTEHLSTRYGEHGVWLGQPVVFSAGRARVRLPALSAAEQELLDAADRKLREAYESTLRSELSIEDLEELAQ